ncbi:ectonucleoside triphosphate diphosphohydrolase 3-like isoform X2 [Antedon mediterranea]
MEKIETGGEPRVVMPSRAHFLVGSLLLVAGVVALITWCAWGNPETDMGTPDSYGVVFDAGSTGTRLYVYRWPGGKVNGTGVVEETAVCTDGEALSTFDTHPEDAGSALETCVNATELPAPKDVTRAFLGATAGMRIVDERNPSISNAIFTSVRKYLHNSKFDFRNDNDARIIDGDEEGISGWISTNYIMKTLEESPKTFSRHVRSLFYSKPKSTIGALDLGGASMQISFIPENAESISHAQINKLRLYGVNYSVYSMSYLCYGANEARRQYLAQLIKDAGFAKVVHDPCGHAGFNESIKQSYIWSLPCTQKPSDIPISPNETFKLVGVGNGTECRRKALNMVSSSSVRCTHKSCGLNSQFQPAPYGNFMAFSGFFYAVSGTGLGENAKISEIHETGLSFCQKNWNDVKDITKVEYVKSYCFNINYVYAVLTRGFKFTEENWNIKFVKKVNGVSLAWSLGFMLNTTNMIPAEAPDTETPINSPAFIVIAVLFAVIAVIGLCLIIYNLRKRA